MPVAEALRRDAEVLFDTVREAGALAMTLLRQDLRQWNKSDGSPVSDADMKVDALLAGRLRKARPAYGWLSEESADDGRLACDRVWIVDPIDGTRAFLQKGDEWCIAVALVDRGRPVIGAIYRPLREEFYATIAGGGSRLNGRRLKMADDAGLDGARVIGNRSSLACLGPHRIVPTVRTTVPLQLRLAFVASGQIDAAVSIGNKNDWDLAAGELMVNEAGGKAADLTGAAFSYNRRDTWQPGLIAAGRKRNDAIVEALKTP